MILETFTKQPNEVQDYDIDFNEYLTSMGGDSITAHVVPPVDGLDIITSTVVNGVVKVFIGGGTSGQKYVVTVRVNTSGGRVREAEIAIKVREY